MPKGAKGYLIITDPDPQRSLGQVAVEECDTFTCLSCNTMHRIRPRCPPSELPTWSNMVGGLICQRCERDPVHFEQKLEAYENRMRFRREL